MTLTRKFVVAFTVTLAVSVSGIQGQTQDDLFNSAVLQRIDLNLHSADWAKLKANFQLNDYYPADFTWNGQTVRNIGIRSRGTGSRSGIKPGLRVDFDKYQDDQRFLGLKAIILRNQTQDASQLHEASAMWLYRKMGIPAPRTSYAKLYVNGVYSGLYVIDDEIDKKFLARVFGIVDNDTQNDGYLYEYHWVGEWYFNYLGPDLEQYKARFSPETHENKPDETLFRPIETLFRLINETPVDGLVAAISDRLDLTEFLRFLAVQSFIAENDGITGAWAVNNFHFYRLEGQAKHVFIAWDSSEAFNSPRLDVLFNFDRNVLVSKLMQIPQFRDTFFSALNEVADVAGEVLPGSGGLGALDAEIHRQADLIDNAVREDTTKTFTTGEYVASSDKVKAFAPERVAYVKCEVRRLTGQSTTGC